jgi:hypothetical protein
MTKHTRARKLRLPRNDVCVLRTTRTKLDGPGRTQLGFGGYVTITVEEDGAEARRPCEGYAH